MVSGVLNALPLPSRPPDQRHVPPLRGSGLGRLHLATRRPDCHPDLVRRPGDYRLRIRRRQESHEHVQRHGRRLLRAVIDIERAYDRVGDIIE